jgi:hypothetical protein
MTFFLDNSMPRRLVDVMTILKRGSSDEFEIIHLKQMFAGSTDDTDWLRDIPPDYIIITGDNKIQTRSEERKALEKNGNTIFYMQPKYPRLPVWEQAWMFLKLWPEILSKSIDNPTKRAFKISRKLQIHC